MLILGAHMSISEGFARAARKTGEELGCNAMQFFTKSPQGGVVKPIDPADAEEFKKLCKKYRIKYVIAHSSYLLNFAKPASRIPWAVQDIMTDFTRLASLGGCGVVVHIGKALEGARQEAIRNVIENAKLIIDQTEKITAVPDAPLQYILENTAGQGSEIGYRLEELGQIWKGLNGFSPRIKSCLDTAHIWAAGYDISSPKAAKETLKLYDQLVGLKTLSCIHFNDSKKALGSRVDRHDNIGRGLIHPENSTTNPQGLLTIARFAAEKSIPLILETPERDGFTHLDDIKMVKKSI
ncbi:deoxyribonuclease IV [Patescibacteria group bacterium]|nr:deoxyribonuclease IV [Patescibacteria group bacterium]